MNDLQSNKELLKSELTKCEVEFTCSSIDQIIAVCEGIIERLENNLSLSENEDLTTSIKLAVGLLSMLAVGDNCDLEKLRTKNDQLRQWGHKLYSLCSKILNER